MRLAFALCLLASPSIAQTLPQGFFDGLDCSNDFSEMALTITGPEIRFYESLCIVSGASIVPGTTGTFRYDVTCSGEGQSWTTGLIIAPTWEDGVVVIHSDGDAIPYQRCLG